MNFDRKIMRSLAGMLHYRGLLALDQALFSATNFVLTITLARVYSDVALAAYGVGLSSALIAQQFQRNIYISRFSLLTPRAGLRYMPGCAAEHLMVIGALSSVFILMAAVAVMFRLGEYLTDIAISTLVCSFIYFQVEFDRMVMIKRGSAMGAFLLSLAYFIVVLATSGIAFYARIPFAAFMGVLIVFSIVKCGWITLYITHPRWGWGMHFLMADMRRYGVSAGMYAVTSAGVVHVPVMVLAASSPPSQVAALVAMRSLTQPLQLVVRSFDIAERNRFRALSGGTTAGARRGYWRIFSLYAGVGVLGLMFVAAAPAQIIHLAYGARFHGTSGLLLGWCVYAVLIGVTSAHMVVIRVLDRDNHFILWLVLGAIAATAFAVLFCSTYGATGAMLGTLFGAAVTAAGGFHTIREVAFGRGSKPLPSQLHSRARSGEQSAAIGN